MTVCVQNAIHIVLGKIGKAPFWKVANVRRQSERQNRIQKMHHGAGLTRGQKLFRQCQFEGSTFQKGVSLNATTILS